MTLKDCSAYNIQFNYCKPILIDTISFERYTVGDIWKAYQQFCSHFLAPLTLMAHKDIRLNQLFKNYIDGIPLDMASALLPARTHLSYSTLSHITRMPKVRDTTGTKIKVSKHISPETSLLA